MKTADNQASQMAHFARTNPVEARAIFDAAISKTTDPDEITSLELCREFFCNPDFAVTLSQHVFEVNTGSLLKSRFGPRKAGKE